MANYDDVRIICDDKETLEEIVSYATDLTTEVYKVKDDEIELSIRNGDPHSKLSEYLKKVSKEKRSIKIKTFVSFDYDMNCEILEIHYSKGKYKVVGVEANYMLSGVGRDDSKVPKDIVNEVCDMFKRIDVIDDETGRIEFIETPITITLIRDDVKYEATKESSMIDFKVYKKRILEWTWDPVESKESGLDDIEDSLPF